MGSGGIESADAGKAVASLAGLEGDEFEAAFAAGARAVRIPRRERVGDRGTVVGDPARRAAARRRLPSERAAPSAIPTRSARRRSRSSRPTASATSSPSSTCGSSAARSGCGVRERTKATCVLTINEMRLDALEIGRRLHRRRQARVGRPDLLPDVRRVPRRSRGGDVDLDRVHARQAAKADLLRYQEPLFAIAGEIPPVEEWPLKSDAAPADR